MLAIYLAWLITGAGDPAIPMAQAWLESRGDVTVVSRVGASRYCGPWQGQAHSAKECVALQNPVIAAQLYRKEIRAWLDATHGDLPGALRGYGCNWKASRPGGHCNNYDLRVVALAKRIRVVGLKAFPAS